MKSNQQHNDFLIVNDTVNDNIHNLHNLQMLLSALPGRQLKLCHPRQRTKSEAS